MDGDLVGNLVVILGLSVCYIFLQYNNLKDLKVLDHLKCSGNAK
jgi:hypothetical protein